MGYNVLDPIPAAQQPDERKITPAQIQIWTASALEIRDLEQRDSPKERLRQRAFRYITMKHVNRGEYPQAFQAIQNIKGSNVRFDTLIRTITYGRLLRRQTLCERQRKTHHSL